jgi:hypothetical protein
MILSVVATLFLLFELLNFKQLKEFIIYGFIIAVVGSIVILNTGFVEQFYSNVEQNDMTAVCTINESNCITEGAL